MSSETIPPAPHDASTVAHESHILQPTIRPVESSDLQVMLAHIGTTNPSYFGGAEASMLETTSQNSKKQGLPHLLLSIPISIAKTLDIPANEAKCTEKEKRDGQMFVGVCHLEPWEPVQIFPEWRRTLRITVNMPIWAHKNGLPQLLVDAAVKELSSIYDTPSDKHPSQTSLVARIFGGEKESLIPAPVGGQKKYKNLIMTARVKKIYNKDDSGNVLSERVLSPDLYGNWGFHRVGRLENVIELDGEGHDVYFYQRKL